MKTHAEAKNNTPSRTHSAPVPNALANQAQLRNALFRAGVQPRLEIGAVNDPLEREADADAARVMRMPEPQAAHENFAKSKASAAPSFVASPGIESELNALNRGGSPLDASSRAFFEPRFGHDFSGVRLHTDAPAARMADALNARAFTLGNDIAFAGNSYSANTNSGRNLLSHELAHVVQQQSMNTSTPQTKLVQRDSDELKAARKEEAEAKRKAAIVFSRVEQIKNADDLCKFIRSSPEDVKIKTTGAIGSTSKNQVYQVSGSVVADSLEIVFNGPKKSAKFSRLTASGKARAGSDQANTSVSLEGTYYSAEGEFGGDLSADRVEFGASIMASVLKVGGTITVELGGWQIELSPELRALTAGAGAKAGCSVEGGCGFKIEAGAGLLGGGIGVRIRTTEKFREALKIPAAIANCIELYEDYIIGLTGIDVSDERLGECLIRFPGLNPDIEEEISKAQFEWL